MVRLITSRHCNIDVISTVNYWYVDSEVKFSDLPHQSTCVSLVLARSETDIEIARKCLICSFEVVFSLL